MYKINPPKIHLSTVLGYDVEGKRYIIKDEKIFDTERELVCFLARYNRPVCNFEGEPIAGRYNNKYMDNQALNGLMRKDPYDEIIYTMYHYPISRLHYKSINDEWKINNYLFWLDTSGQPNYDVRNLRDKVNAEYIRQSEIKQTCNIIIKCRQKEDTKKNRAGASTNATHGEMTQDIFSVLALRTPWRLKKNIEDL